MTDQQDYTARIRAKGLNSTGVTEELAKTLYYQLGSHHLMVVEARVDRRAENGDGSHSVDLVLTQVEPSTAEFLNDHLRELMRAMYRNRALADGDVIPGTVDGPDLRDVVKGSGEAVLARDSEGNADLWDGNTEGAGSCAFPGCGLPFGHDGDHNPFIRAVES